MLNAVCDELLVATNDGSYGKQGLVSDILQDLLDRGEKIRLIFPVGPPIMMKVISDMTRPLKIKTVVSLNPTVDGTGMCGSCRVTVAGKTRFVCSEGIDFDGHEVDWDEMMSRQKCTAGRNRKHWPTTMNMVPARRRPMSSTRKPTVAERCAIPRHEMPAQGRRRAGSQFQRGRARMGQGTP
jgi:hypothetical protein